MIGIVGYMSGGKSYFAVEHMLSMMSQSHRVCSNIRLNCVHVTSFLHIPCIYWKQLYFFLTPDPKGYHEILLTDYNSYPHGSPRGSANYEKNLCYIYLDEVSSLFDSMVHASDQNIQKIATWARHSEKRGIKMYLIMQFASELHKRLRVHITEFISCTNTSNVKVPLLGIGLPFFLQGMTIRTRYLPDGETKIAPAKWYSLNPHIYWCYNTSQIVVGDDDNFEFTPPAVNRRPLFEYRASLCFWLFVVLLVIFDIGFLWGVYHVL